MTTDRLTHANLQSNPKAAYAFAQHGYSGVRLYLEQVREEDSGPVLDAIRRRAEGWVEERNPTVLLPQRLRPSIPCAGSTPGAENRTGHPQRAQSDGRHGLCGEDRVPHRPERPIHQWPATSQQVRPSRNKWSKERWRGARPKREERAFPLCYVADDSA
jgi:hypothetical protein